MISLLKLPAHLLLCCMFLAAAPAFGAIVYLDSFGSQGSGDGQFDGPASLAIGTNGDVYVVDTGNNRIQRFNSTSGYLSQWGSFGPGNGEFKSPAGVAIGLNGEVYVSDTFNNRIQRFDALGTYETQWGSLGGNPGEFMNPSHIVVGNSGEVYVVDASNYRVQKFDADGVYSTVWGSYGSGNEQFGFPFGVAVGPDGMVYVADLMKNRIQKFDGEGNLSTLWGTLGSGHGQFNEPHGIAVSSTGLVYVADAENHRIQKFNANGVFLSEWGSYGDAAGEFDNPHDVAIVDNGLVYVVDAGNNRIQQFFDPDAWSSGYYLFDDDPTTPAVNDAILGDGNPLGDSLAIDATRNLCIAGDLRVIGAGSLALTGGTLFIGSDAVTPTTANTIVIGDGGTLFVDSGRIVVGGEEGEEGEDDEDGKKGKDGADGGLLDIRTGGHFELTDSASASFQGGNGGDGGDGDGSIGNGADGGNGGSGARLTISGGQFSLDGTFNGNGGDGGELGCGGGDGGDGASGARLTISGGQFSFDGTFNGNGGNGDSGGYGGDGGNIHLLGGEMILAAATTINLSSGNGGDGRGGGGSDGQRGDDGTLEIDGGTLIFDGVNFDDVLVAGNFVWKTGTVRLTGDRTIDSIMEVGIIPSTLAVNQTLQIEKTLTLSTDDVLDPSDGSIVVGDAVTSFSPGMICVCNNGTIDMIGGTLTADRVRLEQGGILHIAGGIFNSPFPEMAGGTFIRDSGYTFTSGQPLTGYGAVIGDVYAEYGSRIVATGDLTLGDAASYTGFFSDGRLEVGSHTVTILSKTTAAIGKLVSIDDGTLVVDNGMIVESGCRLVGDGSINGRVINQGLVAAGGPGEELTFNGLVSGAGSFTGSLIFNGGFSPGNSPVVQHLDWATLTENNTLTMELGGLIVGEEYDQLIINELLTIGGTLDVELLGGFTPELGDTFTLFDGLLAGNFAEVNLPGLGDGMSWDYSALCTLGTLTVVPEPSILTLLGLGLIALAGYVRRRRGR